MKSPTKDAKRRTLFAFGVDPSMQPPSTTASILDELAGEVPSEDEKAVKALKPKKGK